MYEYRIVLVPAIDFNSNMLNSLLVGGWRYVHAFQEVNNKYRVILKRFSILSSTTNISITEPIQIVGPRTVEDSH